MEADTFTSNLIISQHVWGHLHVTSNELDTWARSLLCQARVGYDKNYVPPQPASYKPTVVRSSGRRGGQLGWTGGQCGA